jgi:hypothetical protein
MKFNALIVAILINSAVLAHAAGCDMNGDASTNVSDVQLCVNQAIGTIACTTGDIDGSGACNVVDVQRVVNAALGGQCVAGSAGGVLNLPRVTWEGGPAYWSKFPKAVAAGWTQASFFPISVFLPNPGDAQALRAVGINLAMGVNHDVTDTSYTPRILRMTDPDRNPATEDGLFAIPQKEYEGPGEWTPAELGSDYRAVGWFITDECEMGYSGCGNGAWDEYTEYNTQKSRTDAVRAYNDGRFVHSNFGNGVARTWWSPDMMDEHTKLMDSSSVDKYAYTSPNIWNSTDGVIPMSQNWPKNANAHTAAAYGWIIDQMRLFMKAEPAPGNPAPAEPEGLRPAWAFVETAMPFLFGEAGATSITPDQLEGAVWNSIVHEARGVAYFPQNNDACGGYSVINADSTSAACQQQLAARKTKLTTLHAQIRALAPVINTQSFVWNFSNDGIVANNVDTMLKTFNGYAYIFAAVGLEYTGVDTSHCEMINAENVCKQLGTNQPTGTKNFILPPGITGTSVEVVDEGRTLPVVNGSFADNFANEYSHHIYKIALAGG